MKKINKLKLSVLSLAILMSGSIAYAATSPNLDAAKNFAILASTYTNSSSGTNITGDLGYTTGPAVMPSVSGTEYVGDSAYSQAGVNQNEALVALNSQTCTYTFPSGPIDLASDTTHGTVGVYTPGVYCMSGAATIGGGGSITFDGNGTYIFKTNGALTTSANSAIALSNGASACNVWWTPTEATTLGANSTFKGTIIDAAGITVGSTVNWAGSALAYGGTVTTDTDTIIVQTCTIAPVVVPVPVPVATSTPIVVPATTTPIVVTSATTTPVIVAPIISPTPTIVVPKLPNTGFSPIK